MSDSAITKPSSSPDPRLQQAEILELLKAAKALMIACVKADSIEELSAEVDGSLIDAVREAIEHVEARSALRSAVSVIEELEKLLEGDFERSKAGFSIPLRMESLLVQIDTRIAALRSTEQ